MSEIAFFQSIEQTLTLPYPQNPARYDEAVAKLDEWMAQGHDANGRAYSPLQMQTMKSLQQRLTEKKAADTQPRIGQSMQV